MLKIIIQFIILLILLLSNKKAKGSWLTPSGVLIMIYAVCSLMSVFVLLQGEYHSPENDSFWGAMFTFDLFIMLYLLPFRLFNEAKIKTLKLPNKQFLDYFSLIIIVLSFYSIIFYSSTVRFIFSLGDLGAARDIRYVEGEFVEAGILNTIASVSAANYVFAIVLYFIYKTIGNSKTRCRLLFISSFSNAIHVLSFVGRDGIVFWIFTFVFCYAFFRPYLQKSQKKDIEKVFIIGGSVLLVPFFLISLSRFGSSGGGTGNSIISYLGQSFVQGPIYFSLDQKPIYLGESFPLFKGFFNNTSIGSSRMIVGEWVSWMFSTFIVSLYISLDLSGLIVLTLVMLFLFRITVGKAGYVMNLGQMAVYILYFQVIAEGVFYFCHYSRGGNLFIISTLVLSILFSIASKRGVNPIVLRKID